MLTSLRIVDDQTRMVNALRSAARKRDIVDLRQSVGAASEAATERPTSASAASNGLARETRSRMSTRSLRNGAGSGHKSNPSTTSRSSAGVVNFSKPPLSPMTLLSPTGSDRSDDPAPAKAKAFRRKSVDEMTMLLDQMIQDKVDSGQVSRNERGNLRIKRDTVMDRGGMDADGGAESSILEEDEPAQCAS